MQPEWLAVAATPPARADASATLRLCSAQTRAVQGADASAAVLHGVRRERSQATEGLSCPVTFDHPNGRARLRLPAGHAWTTLIRPDAIIFPA